jgi:hypothetical protein
MESFIKGLISLKYDGYCNRCGQCCEVYESGKPCRHLLYEKHTDENGKEEMLAYCNPITLHAGYWGRPLGCALYPYQDDSPLPEKCSYVRKPD